MNSSKKTRTFTGASWQKNPLEWSTHHAAPAHETLVLKIKKQRKGRVTENLRERFVALFLLHLPLALVLRCPSFPRGRGQNLMFGANVELFVAAAAAV